MGDTFWSGAFGAGIVSALVFLWFKAYFEPYLKKKAENLATHEDIAKLINQVRETEQVKADISNRMWGRQARWTAMKEYYVLLIEQLSHLFELFSAYTEGRDLWVDAEPTLKKG